MKVLMLGWELPPYQTGGLGVACYQLCKYLTRAGIEVEFLLPSDKKYKINFMKVTTVPIGASPGDRTESGYSRVLGAYDSKYAVAVAQRDPLNRVLIDNFIKKAVELAGSGQFDAVHAHDWLTYEAGIAIKRATGLPFIAHIHALEVDRSAGGYGNQVVRDIEKLGLELADKIFAVSQRTKQTAIDQYQINPAKIAVTYNSMEISDTADPLAPDNVFKYLEQMKAYGYRVVLASGRLTIQKGFDYLLQAMKPVIEKRPNTILLVMGGGELLGELLEHSAELGISKNVILTGYSDGSSQAWADAYRVSDLYVMPSVSEPFGVAPLEALSFELPVIISKQSGVSEILKNALKVDFWDTKKLANQIISVLDHPALLQELKQAGVNEFKGMSWTTTAEKVAKLYGQVALGASS